MIAGLSATGPLHSDLDLCVGSPSHESYCGVIPDTWGSFLRWDLGQGLPEITNLCLGAGAAARSQSASLRWSAALPNFHRADQTSASQASMTDCLTLFLLLLPSLLLNDAVSGDSVADLMAVGGGWCWCDSSV